MSAKVPDMSQVQTSLSSHRFINFFKTGDSFQDVLHLNVFTGVEQKVVTPFPK